MTDAVSLFFPMFNEEGNIGQAVAAALEVLGSVAVACEVIVIDDGSVDQTGSIADRLAAARPAGG